MANEHTHDTGHLTLHHGREADAVTAALAALRAAGERVTETRRAVLDVLARHLGHLSADEVAAALHDAPRPVHRATVYRALELLARRGIVTPMHTAGGPVVYHLAATPMGIPHLHARCRECGTIVAIPQTALAPPVLHIERSTGFRLEPEQSTLIGLCAECGIRS
ncbi:transcriptional repressor [Microbacterium ulmi]|uniref:Transcriptional repressor n=1 Tax=Microbacterium ulmi TaxID=179095 RepID=A0A7Y2Q2W4_9MICO|nr:Fur family ferric uptake transcriptional regulator [Microbacterium ulmi]NNH05083.1 transcriptional repressor [Microbacterium ulmi]